MCVGKCDCDCNQVYVISYHFKYGLFPLQKKVLMASHIDGLLQPSGYSTPDHYAFSLE